MSTRLGNPFTPSFGCVPFEVAGRQQVLSEILEGLNNRPGDPNRATILVGARGSGKTVLLTLIAEKAEAQGWISVNVGTRPGMLQEILAQAQRKSEHIIGQQAKSHITALNINGFGFERDISSPKNTWREEMTALVQQLNDKGVGLLITVDEASTKEEELKDLMDVFQHFFREKREVAFCLAGLPHNVSMLVSDDSVSFLRRAFRQNMDEIPLVDVSYAMKDTIQSSDREINVEALEVAVQATRGYAFLIQLIGYHIWKQRPANREISYEDVAAGISAARYDMEQMILKPTLQSLTQREEEFLLAMIEDKHDSAVKDIAERMGIDNNNVSQIRKRLIDQGIIAPTKRGRVTFAVPMLKEYLAE